MLRLCRLARAASSASASRALASRIAIAAARRRVVGASTAAAAAASHTATRAVHTSRCTAATVMTGGLSNDLLVSLSMNYNNSGRSHRELIDNLKKNNLITSARVEAAMRAVDRRDYCHNAKEPYDDKPQHIGGGGATISSPHMHAVALEALSDVLVPGARALDIGSGSGYVTTAMALCVSAGDSTGAKQGVSVGVEHSAELVAQSVVNTKRAHSRLFLNRHIQYLVGDGRHILNASQELRALQPFHAVHFGAAVDAVDPAFFAALAVGGKLVAPVRLGGADGVEQDLTVYTKQPDGTIQSRVIMRCVYAALSDRPPPLDISKTYKQQLLDVSCELDTLSAQVKQWHSDFKHKNSGRRPTATELAADTTLKPLLDRVALLRHRQTKLTRLALASKSVPSGPAAADKPQPAAAAAAAASASASAADSTATA